MPVTLILTRTVNLRYDSDIEFSYRFRSDLELPFTYKNQNTCREQGLAREDLDFILKAKVIPLLCFVLVLEALV
jgi:hypothetical protein